MKPCAPGHWLRTRPVPGQVLVHHTQAPVGQAVSQFHASCPQEMPVVVIVTGWPQFPHLFSGAVCCLGSLLAVKVVLVLRRRSPKGHGGGTGGGRARYRGHDCTGAMCPLPLACSLPRALSGRLRLGLAEQSVLAALAQAVSLTPPGQGEPLWPVPVPTT